MGPMIEEATKQMEQIPESIIEQAAIQTQLKKNTKPLELIQTIIKIAILFGQEFKC